MSEKALCEVNMTYSTMRSYFRAAERAHQHLSGFIVFSPASFEKEYSVESRTYAVSSDNKAFRPMIIGDSGWIGGQMCFAHYLGSNWIFGCKGKSHKGEVSL